MRAVVVGAGIGGLATAIALEQAGVEPIVIERAPQLHEAGFGLVVSANAVTALRMLGLRDGVAARGTRVRRAEIRNPRGELLTLIDYETLGWETYGILRTELQQAMLEIAPAARLRLGTICIGATEDGQVLLDGADPVIADVVVGADGIRSAGDYGRKSTIRRCCAIVRRSGSAFMTASRTRAPIGERTSAARPT